MVELHSTTHVSFLMLGFFVLVSCNPADDSSALACEDVPLEALLDDPFAFDGHYICTQGLADLGYSTKLLTTLEREASWSQGARLSIPLTHEELLARGIRQRDVLRIEGVFQLDEHCASIYNADEPEPHLRGCFPTNLPATFNNAVIEILERYDAWSECQHVPIEEIYEDPAAFDGQLLCTSGEIAWQDDFLIAVPLGMAIDAHTTHRMDLEYSAYAEFDTMHAPQSQFDVAGILTVNHECGPSVQMTLGGGVPEYPVCTPPFGLNVLELQWTSRVDPAANCQTVELADVYGDPAAHEGQVICSSAEFTAYHYENGEIEHFTVDPITGSANLLARPVTQDTPSGMQESLTNGSTQMSFIGYFDTYEECLIEGHPMRRDVELNPEDSLACHPHFHWWIFAVEPMAQ